MSRFLFDATGAVSGGIVRVLLETLRAWPAGDAIHVVGSSALCAQLPTRATSHAVSGDSRGRFLAAALTRMRGLRAELAPDAVVSISPGLPGAVLRPDVTVLHDLFFRLWPAGESRAVRSYRALSYRRALQATRVIACVSSRTHHDLLGWMPDLAAKAEVWYEAPADCFVEAFEAPSPAADGRYVVVPAHNDYKGAELVVEAFAEPGDPAVHLLAGSPTRARTLEDRFSDAEPRPHVLQRLDDHALARHVAGAAALIMPSHIEGFGLPVLEAMAVGTPVIVSPDPALWEASKGTAVRMHRWDSAAVRSAWAQCRELEPQYWSVAQGLARSRTWSHAAGDLRQLAIQ